MEFVNGWSRGTFYGCMGVELGLSHVGRNTD